MNNNISQKPRILTTTVGSYSQIDWLQTLPNDQTVSDATQIVINTQRRLGIDLPTDGELYRFDANHPDTNGMIEYFTRRISGIRSEIGISDVRDFNKKKEMSFRRKPAGVVYDALGEGSLDLLTDCNKVAAVANGDFKFTLTSPYMLARTLFDQYYNDFEALTLAIADVMAEQVSEMPSACVQIDEANITGNPKDGPIASKAINRILEQVQGEKAVHFCFGNYGGQSIQKGNWESLIAFLNSLKCDHLILELAHRPGDDLIALSQIDERIGIGIGVIDVKVNHVESPSEVADRIETAEKKLGEGRIKWVHPDCGFWMLKRSIADRKMESLVKGRDLYLGI